MARSLDSCRGYKLDLGGELIQASLCAGKLMDSGFCTRVVQSKNFEFPQNAHLSVLPVLGDIFLGAS